MAGFFGFDTSLPRDRATGSGNRGIFEHNDAFAGIQQARKLQAFQDTEDEMYVRCVGFEARQKY